MKKFLNTFLLLFSMICVMFNAVGAPIYNLDELDKERDWNGKVVSVALLGANFVSGYKATDFGTEIFYNWTKQYDKAGTNLVEPITFGFMFCPSGMTAGIKSAVYDGVITMAGEIDDIIGIDIKGTVVNANNVLDILKDAYSVIDGSSKGLLSCADYEDRFHLIQKELLDSKEGKGGHFSYRDAVLTCRKYLPYSSHVIESATGHNISYRSACLSFVHNLMYLSHLWEEYTSARSREDTCRFLVDSNALEISVPAICSGECTLLTASKVTLSNPETDSVFTTEVNDFCKDEKSAYLEQTARGAANKMEEFFDHVVKGTKKGVNKLTDIFGFKFFEDKELADAGQSDKSAANEKIEKDLKSLGTEEKRRTKYVYIVTKDKVEDVTDLSNKDILEKYYKLVEAKKE